MLRRLFCALALSSLLLAGCEPAPVLSPDVQAARDKYLLDQPPGDPIMIADARKQEAKSQMIVTGKLGVSGQQTFEKGLATFCHHRCAPQGGLAQAWRW